MQTASKTLYECMSEVYEPDWTGHDLLTVQSQNIEMLWQDLGHKMTDQVLIPLNTYQGQFPEMRVRHYRKLNKEKRNTVVSIQENNETNCSDTFFRLNWIVEKDRKERQKAGGLRRTAAQFPGAAEL